MIKNMKGSFAPFNESIFRSLWIGSFVSNIGTWMQNIGVAWISTSMSSSAMLISLTQVALSLPALFISYPAGVISDHTDRRTLLIIIQLFLFFTVFGLAFLTYIHLVNIYVLIAFNLLVGIGSALSAPVWQAIIPEIVGETHLKNAIALNGLNFNLSRAIGPALGGLLLVSWGVQSIFLFNSISFLALVIGLYYWHNKVKQFQQSTFKEAFVAGLKAVKLSSAFTSLLLRTLSFTAFVSIVFAILPHLSKYEWHQNSRQFTAIWGLLGLGALLGSIIFNKLTDRFRYYIIVGGSCEIVGACLLILGYMKNAFIIDFIMFIVGIGWICITSTLNVLAQLYSPAEFKGRFLSVNITFFQGSIAVSSIFWGYFSDLTSALMIFRVAGIGMMVICGLLLFFPMKDPDFRPETIVPCTEPLLLPINKK